MATRGDHLSTDSCCEMDRRLVGLSVLTMNSRGSNTEPPERTGRGREVAPSTPMH